MKFRNVTTDDLRIPALAIVVEAGAETPDLTPEQATEFADQAGKWEPVKTPKNAAKEND